MASDGLAREDTNMDNTPNTIRAFLAPYKLTKDHYWSDESTITQAGIGSGSVQPQQVSALGLVTSGSQGDKTIVMQTSRAGQIVDSPEFIWQESGDPDWYGRDGVTHASRWEIIQTNTVASTEIIPRDVLGLDDGTVLVSADRQETVNAYCNVYSIDPQGGVTETTVYTSTTGTLTNAPMYSSLCLMPDGSIMLYVVVSDTVDLTVQVDVYRSTDQGKSWAIMAESVLPSTIDVSGSYGIGTAFSIKGLKCRTNQSQTLMVMELESHDSTLTSAHIIVQYASISQGARFKKIYQSTGSDRYYQIGLVQWSNYWVLTYASAHNSYASLVIHNAYESIGTLRVYTGGNVITTNTIATVSGNRLQNGNISSWVDTDGIMYVAYRGLALDYRVESMQSTLLGLSGSDIAKDWYGVGQIVDTNTNTSYISNFVVGSAQGRQLLAHNMRAAGTNNHQGALYGLWVGGYSTVTMPANNSFALPYEYSGMSEDWLPIDLPQTTNWTANGSGTEALAAGYLQVQTTTTTHTRDYNQSINKDNGITVLARCQPVSGGSRTLGNGIEVRIEPRASTSTSIWVRFGIGIDGVSIYDVHAGATLAEDSTFDTTDGVEVIISVDNETGACILWYKTDGLGAKKYNQLTGTASASSSVTGNVIKFGLVGTNGTNQTARWYQMSYAEGNEVGLGLNDFVNPTDLNGRPYPPNSIYVYVDNGLNVSTFDGPARKNDEYKIQPYYANGYERMLYSVSPSIDVKWRSEAVADPDATAVSSQRLAWALDEQNLGVANGLLGNDLMGIHMSGLNFRTFDLLKYVVGSGWSVVNSFDNGINFTFERKGSQIFCTDTSGRYIHFNECSGWSIQLTSGAVTVVRAIVSNVEGVLASGTGQKRWVATLDGITGSEPLTGQGYLIPDKVTCVLDLTGSPDAAAWAIDIDSQKTVNGDFSIGTFLLGPVVVPTHQYSRGRSILRETDIDSNIQADGVSRANRRGRGGRQVSIQWAEGVDISDLYDTPSEPDYWTSTTTAGATPIAVDGNAPTLVLGLLDYLDGPSTPLVYLPSILRSSGSTDYRLYNRYHEHLLGILIDNVTIDNVLGEELEGTGSDGYKIGEVFRVANLLIREVR